MGLVALWILWGNTVLVAAAAVRQARALSAHARSFGPVSQAQITSPGPIAEHLVDQLGRSGAGEEPSIVWHDRGARAAILGGELAIGGELVDLEPSEDAEVWLDEAALQSSSGRFGADEFEAAYVDAQKPRGFARTLVTRVEAGPVFVAGQIERGAVGQKPVLRPSPGHKLLLSTVDPRAFARSKGRFVWFVFLPGILLGATIPTALALTPPVFEGWLSKLGGLLGLVFFLLVLPAGTKLRDFLRDPQRRFVRGRWVAVKPRAT